MNLPNSSYIKNLSQGNIDFEKHLIEIIRGELANEIETYRSAIDSKDFETAASMVHKLKHKIGVVGLSDGYQLAIDYEENLKLGKKDLQSTFEKLLPIMLDYIGNYEVE